MAQIWTRKQRLELRKKGWPRGIDIPAPECWSTDIPWHPNELLRAVRDWALLGQPIGNSHSWQSCGAAFRRLRTHGYARYSEDAGKRTGCHYPTLAGVRLILGYCTGDAARAITEALWRKDLP